MDNFQYELSQPLCSNYQNLNSYEIQISSKKSNKMIENQIQNHIESEISTQKLKDETLFKHQVKFNNQKIESNDDIEQQQINKINSYTQISENESQTRESIETQEDINFQIQYFQSQIIKPNKEMNDHVKIFYKFCLLKKNFSEIFGEYEEDSNVDELQFVEQKDQNNMEQQEISSSTDSDIFKQKMTVQNIYLIKNLVVVKTLISDKYSHFIIQKTLYQNVKQSLESFIHLTNKETDILRLLNQKKSRITVPFLQSKTYKVENSNLHACDIQMFSGIKSLQQVKQQYLISQKFEEYVILLQFAFNQLLLKLNEMHHVAKIAHSDIKPQNIIIGYDYNFYFIDFGGSIYLENKDDCQNYLQSFTPYYNLEKQIAKKRQQNWTIQKIIDCDTTQLILTFLYMLDFDLEGYENLRQTGKTEKYRSCLKVQFEEFGGFLIKIFSFIAQKQINKYIPVPQQQILLVSNLENQFQNMMSNQQDILFNEQTQQYELKFINQFSIQIIEIIIKYDPRASFSTTNETLVEEYLNFNTNNKKISTQEHRNLKLFPKFCQAFELPFADILFLALTKYKFNQKAQFICKILHEYSRSISQIGYESELILQILNIDQSRQIHLHIIKSENTNQISFEIYKFQNDVSKQILLIQLELMCELEIQKLFKSLEQQLNRSLIIICGNNSLVTHIIKSDQLLKIIYHPFLHSYVDLIVQQEPIYLINISLFRNAYNKYWQCRIILESEQKQKRSKKPKYYKIFGNRMNNFQQELSQARYSKYEDFNSNRQQISSSMDQKSCEHPIQNNDLNTTFLQFLKDKTQLKNQRDFEMQKNENKDDIEQQQETKKVNFCINVNQPDKIESNETLFNSFQVQYFQSQIIKLNNQIKDHVKIYYKSCELKQKFNEIFGEIEIENEDETRIKQQEFQELKNENSLEQLQVSNNYFSNKKVTLQTIYLIKNFVQVKTLLSDKYSHFIIQKIIYQSHQQSKESFINMANKETEILKLLKQKKSSITVPFLHSKIYEVEDVKDKKLHVCDIQMFSGIKSLQQIKQQYFISQKFEEYVILLQFAFSQLLLKLNEMHHVVKIAHSDIKPQNIIIGYDYNFYFIDFGGSIYLEKQDSCQKYLQSFTPYYNLEKNNNEKLARYILQLRNQEV
ncbi:hypothetical protein ABPG73_006771 [Tetrahymena malaccensis]